MAAKTPRFTVPTLTPEQGAEVAGVLQQRLHSLNDLALTLKHVHWNVVGPNFIAVHEMLDPQVDAVRAMVDEIAERIATLGVPSDAPLPERFVAREGLLGPLADDPHQPPALELGERPGLHDLDGVAAVRLVGLVVHVADRAPPHHLAVLRVRHESLDHDPPRLVHLVGRHDPDLGLATGAGRRRGRTG